MIVRVRARSGAAGPDHDSDTRGVSDPRAAADHARKAVEGGRSRPDCSLRRRSGGGTERRLVRDLEVREAERYGDAPDLRADAISLRIHAVRAIPAQKIRTIR